MLHPGEGNSSEVALAEAQQERARFSVLQQSALHLFTHKAHDVAVQMMVVQEESLTFSPMSHFTALLTFFTVTSAGSVV